MTRDTGPIVLIVENDRGAAEEYAEWLDGYEVRIATDADAAIEQFDAAVDVVLLDRDLSDVSSAELLGRLRGRATDCQIAMLSGNNPDVDLFQLDIDEYVPRPISREELRSTVDRLNDRNEIEGLLDTYLTLVARKRGLEDRKEPHELEDDQYYRETIGELAGRRQQLASLLSQLGAPKPDVEIAADESKTAAVDAAAPGFEPPLYRTRKREFYLLWFLAVLTYGVGDLTTTMYAVVTIPGLIEGNPVVDTIIRNFGLPGFLLLKLLVFLVLISISVQGARVRDRFSYYWPPLTMTALGLLLTGWNLSLILSVIL